MSPRVLWNLSSLVPEPPLAPAAQIDLPRSDSRLATRVVVGAVGRWRGVNIRRLVCSPSGMAPAAISHYRAIALHFRSALNPQASISVKVTSNSARCGCGARPSVVNILLPRGRFHPEFASVLGTQNFFKKRLARHQAVRIMRDLGGGNPPGKRLAQAAVLLLNNQIKTDVWALVGMVITNYSDTTSDH